MAAEGRRTLAHELAHVVQQSRGGRSPDTVALESDATGAADQVAAGQVAEVSGSSGVVIALDDKKKRRQSAAPSAGSAKAKSKTAATPKPARAKSVLRETPGGGKVRDSGKPGRQPGDPMGIRQQYHTMPDGKVVKTFEWTDKNIQRMLDGKPPIGADGKRMELHHRGQSPHVIDEYTNTLHKEQSRSLHDLGKGRRDYQPGGDPFPGQRERHWRSRARDYLDRAAGRATNPGAPSQGGGKPTSAPAPAAPRPAPASASQPRPAGPAASPGSSARSVPSSWWHKWSAGPGAPVPFRTPAPAAGIPSGRAGAGAIPPLMRPGPATTSPRSGPGTAPIVVLDVLHDFAESVGATQEYETWGETLKSGPGRSLVRLSYEAVEGAKMTPGLVWRGTKAVGRGAKAAGKGLWKRLTSDDYTILPWRTTWWPW